MIADHKFGGHRIFSFSAADGWPNFFPADFRLSLFFRRRRPNSAADGSSYKAAYFASTREPCYCYRRLRLESLYPARSQLIISSPRSIRFSGSTNSWRLGGSCPPQPTASLPPYGNANARNVTAGKTRKLSYCKDDRAMRPIYGCPENFRECHGYFYRTFNVLLI